MKRLFNFVALTAMMLMVSVNVLAQPANLYTAQKINGSTDTAKRSVAPTRTDGSKYYFDIDASTSDTEIWFVFKVDGWTKNYLFAYSNGDAPGTSYNIATSWGQSDTEPTKWFKLTTTGYSKITICIDLTYKSNISGFNFTTTYTSAGGTVNPGDYYLVSEELTGGKMLPEFKFSPSRKRKGGAVLSDQYSFNFPDFLLDARHKNVSQIKWYIKKGDGTEIRPNKDYHMGDAPTTDNKNQGNGTTWSTYDATTGGTAQFITNRYEGVSYTIFLYTGNNKVEMLWNSTAAGTGSDAGSYYLTGNFTNADASANIEPWTTTGRRLMTRIWYKNGVEYTTDPQNADSVIYRVTVPRPAAGWKDLYLAVFSENTINEWSSKDNPGSEDNLGNYWRFAIRPQVQWNYKSSQTQTKPDGVDATALHGGLYSRKEGSDDTQQALNPTGVTDDYSSYTFSMNITNSTYRIIFNKDLYIMGPAINNNDGDDDDTCWSSASPDTQTKHAYKLTYVAAENCYKYLDNGEETAIPFTQGKAFAFAFNKTFTNTVFMEDDVVPVALGDNDAGYALAASDQGNQDTQYVNFLKESTTDNATHSTAVSDITYNLPTASRVIRLYVRAADDNNPDEMDVYYVMKDRTVKFYNPGAETVSGMTDSPNAYKSYYDCHATYLPTTVQAYAVASYASEKNADNSRNINLRELKVDNGGLIAVGAKKVLPANTPVILARQTSESAFSYMTFEYYEAPNTEKTATNLLKGTLSSMHIEQQEGSSYNYIFGYNKFEDGTTKIGFFKPGTGKCAINTAYLQIGEDLFEGKYWMLSVLSDEDFTEEPIEEPAVEPVVNGIETINAASSESAPWFTLEGSRVNHPTKGIYIHNGKKVVIK